MLVLVAAILRDPRNELPVPDKKKATFYAAAKLNVRYCFFLLKTKN